MVTIDCVAYLMTYELHVLEVYVYGTSNAVLYYMDSTLQRLRAVCAATACLLLSIALHVLLVCFLLLTVFIHSAPIAASLFINSVSMCMWPSFRAIGRGTSENEWRNKKKKERNITGKTEDLPYYQAI